MRLTNLQGIVVSQKEYSDADMLVTMFSRQKGKSVAIAKGIRKLTSRKRGSLQPFSYVNFQMTDSDHLNILIEATPIQIFPQIRQDLAKMSVAYFFCEVVLRVTQENEPHDVIFSLLLESLKELDRTSRLKSLRQSFATEILIHLGFWPQNKPLKDPDRVLEEVIERKLSSIRIGKQIQ